MKKILVLLLIAFALLIPGIPEALCAEFDFTSAWKRGQNVTLQKYPDADAVVLYERETVSYQPDGTDRSTDEYFVKILTEKGRRQFRTLSFYFQQGFSRVAISRLEIVRPDGTLVQLDAQALSNTASESGQMSENIYDPNQKILSVTIPDLRIGDILSVLVDGTVLKPRVPGVWSGFYSLEGTLPICEYIVQIDAPADKPLKTIAIKEAQKDAVSFEKTEKGDRIVYTWTERDVPMAIAEEDMPPMYLCVRRLLVSTAANWEEISRWYYNLCRPRLAKVTPEMRTTVAELTKDAKTDREKIERLFQFVSQKIRYMGITPEEESPGYEPHDVSLTFENRYGVCRDKAALLAAMLQIAGFDASPVLFYVGPPKDADAPNPYFNHAITGVRLKKGEWLLMDPTFETTRELLPSALARKSFLPAVSEGETLGLSPEVPAQDNLLHIRNTANISATRDLTGTVSMTFEGINDQIYRGAFARWNREYREQFFSSLLKRAIAGAELVELRVLPENVRDTAHKLEVHLQYRVRDFLSASRDVQLLPNLFLGNSFGATALMTGSLGLEKRRFPLEWYSTCALREELAVTLPENFAETILPKDATVPGKIIDWNRSWKLAGRTISGVSAFSIASTRVESSDYPLLKTALRAMESLAKKQPVLKAPESDALWSQRFPAADTIILRRNCIFQVLNASDAIVTNTERREIRTYAGIKKNSELRIFYHPDWEKVEVIRGVVTAPDGTQNVLTAKEINEMDAPWVGAAPRWGRGRILVLSFPGVREGSVMEWEIRRTLSRRALLSHIETFAASDPVAEQSLTLETPDDFFLRISPPPPGVEFTEKVQGHLRTRRWTVRRIAPLPPEPDTPPARFFAPSVFFSNFDTVRYAEFFTGIFQDRAKPAESLREAVKKLTENARTPRERLDRLRLAVAQQIRTEGPNFEAAPPDRLAEASETWQDRYGNGADQAILLKTFLDLAGIPATFIFVAPWKLDPEPFAQEIRNYFCGDFNDVLVRAEVPESGVFYCGGAGQYAPLGVTGADGAWAIDTQGKIFRLDSGVKNSSGVERTFDLKFSPDGSAVLKNTIAARGLEYESLNRMFSEFTPETRRRNAEEFASSVAQNASVRGDWKIERTPDVFRCFLGIALPAYAAETGEYRYFPLPGFEAFARLMKTASPLRSSPVWRAADTRIKYRWRVELPENWRSFRLAPDRFWELPGGGFLRCSRSVDAEGKHLEILCEAELKAGILPPEFYPAMENIQKFLSSPESFVVLLSTRRQLPSEKERP